MKEHIDSATACTYKIEQQNKLSSLVVAVVTCRPLQEILKREPRWIATFPNENGFHDPRIF